MHAGKSSDDRELVNSLSNSNSNLELIYAFWRVLTHTKNRYQAFFALHIVEMGVHVCSIAGNGFFFFFFFCIIRNLQQLGQMFSCEVQAYGLDRK